MKIKSYNLMLLIAVFIFIFTLLINQSIYEYKQSFTGIGGEEKITISLKNSKSSNILNVEKVNEFTHAIGNLPAVFYTHEENYISSDFQGQQAEVYCINGDLNLFYKMPIMDGIFLKEKHNLNKEKVAVIDDTIAFELYKTYDVKGRSLKIAGENFKIIGIIKRDSSLLGSLINSGKGSVYIPMEVMKEQKNINSQFFPFKNIEILTYSHSLNNLKETLIRAGINHEHFIIEDQNIEATKILQRKKLLIFLISGFSVLYLLKYLVQIIKNIINIISKQLKKSYFLEAVNIQKKALILKLLKLVGVAVSIVFLWNTTSFQLYIEPNKIPKDPTDLNLILNIIKESVSSYLNNEKVYMLPINEILYFLKSLSLNSFLLGLISGIVVILSLINTKKKSYKEDLCQYRFTRVSFYLMAGVFVSVILLVLTGLPVKLILIDILIVYCCLTFLSWYPFLMTASQQEIKEQQNY